MPLLDIVIVTYNSSEVILPCLNSICPALPETPVKIIAIDNHSCDSTAEILHEFSRHKITNLEFLFIENQENTGFTSGLNQGLRESNAEFILILNPDTILPENGLQTLIDSLRSAPETGIIAPQLRYPDGRIQPSCRRLPQRRDVFFHAMGLHLLFAASRIFNGWKMGDFDHRSDRFVAQPQGAFLLTKKSVLQNVGYFDEKFPMFFSDVDWCRRVAEAGFKIRFTPDVAVIHHQGQAVNSRRAMSIISSHLSFIRYFWKYDHDFYGFIPNLATTVLLIILGFLRFLCARFFR